ncbi:glycosyltransferase family 2 protein [Aliarcobacter cryaerophilus]|uniref:glycosyltransferase family 2 protein n=1 Tax=Aliarcobacter cryaerophilus TaxID=28198 RepID=UPI0021B66174|nr:glycosyltransferase [Aliarcobacter cryaerophilus]MCT7530916.1 glycosyltransferase [Aliarcobacter cryaerophilus]
MPKISIIIPVYNTEQYLVQCIDSILNQTLKDIEIILINDGSTDNSYKILQEYKKKDSRIVLINQKNKGQGKARNVGIKIAKATYLAFVDSDDFISPLMLENLYLKIIQDNADIVKCAFTRVHKDGSNTNENSKPINPNKEDFFKTILSIDYLSIFPNGIYKKELFVKNNLFFKKMLYEDAELLFKIIYYSENISYIDDILYFWRKTDNSTSRSIGKKQIDDIFKVIELTYKFLKKYKLNKKYKFEFLQRYFYYSYSVIDKIINYGKDDKEKYIKYFDKKISENIFFDNRSLNILKLIKKRYYINYIMKKASLFLCDNQEIFTEFSEYFCKDIYNLSNKKNNYILYGNGTIAEVIQNIIPNKIIGYVDISDINHHPSTLKNINFDKIIITVLGREYGITKYLVDNLKINKDKILTLQEIIKYNSKMYEDAKGYII